jgi:hypothetical protein
MKGAFAESDPPSAGSRGPASFGEKMSRYRSAAHDVSVPTDASEASGKATCRSAYGTIIGKIGANLIQ